MTTIERRLRILAGVLALLGVLALVHPPRAEPQPADLVAQGRQALDAGRVDDAIALFERAVAADAGNPAALAWLGNARVRKARTVPPMEGAGWVSRGFATLDDAVERFPEAFIVHMLRGITALNVPAMFNKAGLAVKDLGAVVALRDTQPSAVPESVMPAIYLNLGLALKKVGDRDGARRAWTTGRTLYPAAAETVVIDRELRGL